MLRVRVLWSGVGGTPYLSTHYFEGTTQTEANDAVTAIGAFWGGVDAWCDSSNSWATESEVLNLDAATGQPLGTFVTAVQSGTGALAGSNLPFASQGLIRWRTGEFINGKEVRGRTFIPALNSTNILEGQPTAALVTAINGFCTTLLASATSDLVVWSRAHGVAHTTTSGTMWNQFAVLRTRRPSF